MPNNATYNQVPYNTPRAGLLGKISGYFANTKLTKRYYYKIYTKQGTYVTTWSADVISDPEFRSVINGGYGELKVNLGRKYDNFGEGNDVTLLNKVELWVADADNVSNNRKQTQWDVSQWDASYWDSPLGSTRKIYTGYISAYTPYVDDETQYVEVVLLGYITEGSFKIVKDGSGNTRFTLTGDPATLFKTIINYYRADGNTNINYTGNSIQYTGLTTVYTFNEMTLIECLNKIVEVTPSNWFWFIDANGNVNLKQSSMTQADHKLFIGRDMSYLESNRRAENITNRVYIIGGGTPTLYNVYKRDASIAAYGSFDRKIQDGNVTDNITADIMAKRVLDMLQDPETRAVIRVVDNNGQNSDGQDIESFNVGDTIQIKNLNFGAKSVSRWDVSQWDVDVWDNTFRYTLGSVLVIVSLSYYKTYIEIEVSSRLPEVTKRIEDVSKLVNQQIQETIPNYPAVRTV